MSIPLISIIVPVYNAEKTLRQCVDSIQAQEYKDFELLLIDDGSKDGSPAICDEYAEKDARVRVFHKENGGVSSARNLGLDHAQAEWITFIDSDDEISNNYLCDIVDLREDIVLKGFQSKKNDIIDGVLIFEIDSDICDLTLLINKYVTNPILRCPWAKFYRKQIIDRLRFLSGMRIGEDAWFVFNYISKCNSFRLSKQGTYIFRKDDNPDEVKYAITVDYAVQSLMYLKVAFEKMVQVHGVDRGHFLSYIGYFKRISKSDWEINKSKWYGNKEVKALYNYVWPDLSCIQKLRLIISRLVRA